MAHGVSITARPLYSSVANNEATSPLSIETAAAAAPQLPESAAQSLADKVDYIIHAMQSMKPQFEVIVSDMPPDQEQAAAQVCVRAPVHCLCAYVSMTMWDDLLDSQVRIVCDWPAGMLRSRYTMEPHHQHQQQLQQQQ